jgi:hypothetical protein
MSMDYETTYDGPPQYRIGIPRRHPLFDVLPRAQPEPAPPGPPQLVGAPQQPVTQPQPAPAGGDTIMGFPRNYVLIGAAAIAGYFLLGKRR